MTQPLRTARILVADDQSDVARTLCRPLQKAGARLRFVTDGEAALREIEANPFDLVLADMKMPPQEWGGLWLLRQLKDGGWRVPSLVLSGEGSKKQVIEALRLDASDWVDKDDAGDELLAQCVKILTDRLDQSLTLAGGRFPSPLAHRFARYDRVTDSDKKTVEGLHTLEAVFRFTAVLGLSSMPPAALRGITLARLGAPSMGTWFDVCVALSKLPGAGEDFRRMLSWLVPESADHATVQELIALRNDIAHGRGEPTAPHAESLDALLRRFAHRGASSWRAEIAVPTSMTYDGSAYSVDVLNLVGTGKPVPGTLTAQTAPVTGQAFLVPRAGAPLPLAPWLLTYRPPGTDDVRCLQFDGLQRGRTAPAGGAPFRFAKTDDGTGTPTVGHPDATEQTLSRWATT